MSEPDGSSLAATSLDERLERFPLQLRNYVSPSVKPITRPTMQAWITDRPSKKRRRRSEDAPRLELPLDRPRVEREPEQRDTKGEKDASLRGVAEVDFYI